MKTGLGMAALGEGEKRRGGAGGERDIAATEPRAAAGGAGMAPAVRPAETACQGRRAAQLYPCGLHRYPVGSGDEWVGSTQATVSGGSAGAISKFTTTGSCPLRTSTQLSGASRLALISW